MNKVSNIYKTIKQFFEIRNILKKNNFQDDQVYYQGHIFKKIVTPSGLAMLLFACITNRYDQISQNHGIKRLKIQRYDLYTLENGARISTEGVIWDYRPRTAPILFRDHIINALESNFSLIKNDFIRIKDQLSKFPDSDDLTNDNGLWAYAPLFNKDGIPNAELSSLCRDTLQLLNSLNLNITFGFCMFSSLKPHSKIAPHCGSSSFRQRYHLGISIPEPGKSKIRILDQWVYWAEGEAFGFNDSYEHEVIHDGSQERVVFIVDVWPKTIPTSIQNLFTENASLKNFGVL
ncbi:aspartyl/asparaginyl beta-hydroxylase domain-containing protein [Polynucleobacter paneuropaeus]|nr:aspartyl/asparaginyl beta-hydroxylase domain-containing protein [Polynucleobacter paneuropaeus]